MRYFKSKRLVKLGDQVVIDGNHRGQVVCDFDAWQCLRGYAQWLAKSDQAKQPGILDRGVMIEADRETEHFSELDGTVAFIRRADGQGQN
jgi:hypothetical protein